ncbi:MAG: MarR family transcriptional regulator [Clostridia bacterium]|nr:MarR family transcriptional regulator [Clostridia bacterium]
MTLKERILLVLKNGPLSDRELADRILGKGSPQQSVNQACRQLAGKGIISRTEPPIRNILVGEHADIVSPLCEVSNKGLSDSQLQEEAIKDVLNDYLINAGWQTKVAWGGTHGTDIEATRGSERWLIEVKGCGSRNAMRVNYFLSILGEILQRMDDCNAHYSIALPDMQQFRNLWSRLPALAKERTTIDAIFVSETGQIDFVK